LNAKNTIVFEFGKLTTSGIVVSNDKKRSLVTNLFYDGQVTTPSNWKMSVT